MKQSQYVVHNRGLSQILFATPWSVRSIFKHVLVASFIAFITIIAFDFNAFKDALEGTINGTATVSITETAKLGSPQIAWDILLIFLEVRLLRRALKMLQTSNRNMLIFIPFGLITIAAGAFVAAFLPSWMQAKLILEKDFIDGFKMLSVFIYIYMAVPVLTIVWSLANAINERRISPFVARANILTSINMMLWLGALSCVAEIAHMLYLSKITVEFNFHDPLQIFLILFGAILLVTTVVTSIWSQHDMRVKTNYKFFNKNIEQAVAVAMVVPLTIWLCSSFIQMNNNLAGYLFIALIAIVVIACIAYAFIRRTEIGSPRVFMVVVALMLTIIWMGKFFFEYFWPGSITAMFTLPIAMIATSVIISTIYWKSPMASKLTQFMFARFVKTLWIVVVASWAVSLVPTLQTFAPVVGETLNLLLMALPIVLLAISLLYWYVTQWKIKSHITFKEKRDKKKKDLKEANNA